MAVRTGTAPSAWADPADLLTALEILEEQEGGGR